MAANSFEDIPLPKQLYRLKFFWTFKTAMNRRYIKAFFGYSWFIYISWNDDILSRVFFLTFFSLSLIESFNKSRVATMKMEDKMQYILTIREQEIGAN